MTVFLIVLAYLIVTVLVGMWLGHRLRARRRADEMEHARRERERREALNRISGGPGSGWRRR